MPNNNGNLKVQQVYIPQVDNSTYEQHYDATTQYFEYDSLNRLQFTNEASWRQQYVYDRYGNRTIDQNSSNTYGDGIPKPNFAVDTTNNSNRLIVPSGYSGTMHYDATGNLDVDTYSAAAVSRLYDAENRMTKETQASSYVAGEYSYDGDGHRVKRKFGNVETWHVYGIGGELIAEYAANTSYTTPQKEYGYRNGQLLITATCGSGYGEPPTLHDNPLVVGETTVQARHITELRTAINTLRAREGMSAFSWQTSATTSDWITAGPIAEMRTALNQVLGPPPAGYSAGLAQGQPIKAVHIQELRDRLMAVWSIDIRWMVTDHLGTPRMIFDLSGSLATVSRHDYLPFGEELFAGTGGRTQAQGYSLGDGARQKFTQYERDIETGLDYAQARYYASAQGRFTSIDPYNIVMETQFAADAKKAQAQFIGYLRNPQRWNRYSYALNNPLLYTDPNGEDVTIYYRPPKEGEKMGDSIIPDQGHLFIYVRNDETGESAYFDYYVEGGYTVLAEVTDERISQHASLTIETTGQQEQAILGGIKEMQQSAPNYDLVPNNRDGVSHCTNNSVDLLKRGGIDAGGLLNRQLPPSAWNSLFMQYARDQVQTVREYTGSERGRQWNDKLVTPSRVGESYGRDPRGQARRVDPNATNNRRLLFRDGKRQN